MLTKGGNESVAGLSLGFVTSFSLQSCGKNHPREMVKLLHRKPCCRELGSLFALLTCRGLGISSVCDNSCQRRERLLQKTVN